jgi:hypothetical protein
LIIFSVVIASQFLLLTVNDCQAASLIDKISGKCAGGNSNSPASDCDLNDFVQIAIDFAYILLGLTGSLALGAFIYGGVVLLISGGSSEKVTQAKSIFVGAIIGLVVVFASWTIIGFIFNALGIQGNWFSSSWFGSS